MDAPVELDVRRALPIVTIPRELRVYLLGVGILWCLSLADPLRFVRTPEAASAFRFLYLAHPLSDLFCFLPRFGLLHRETFFTLPGVAWSYPAPCIFIYKCLYAVFPQRHLEHDVFDLYLVSSILCLLLVAFCFFDALVRNGLARLSAAGLAVTAGVLSWPIYFSLERGNIEGFLWCGIAAAIYFYVTRSFKTAAVLLGVLAAFKIYPLLYFGLFFRRRQAVDFAVAAATLAATSIASLMFVGPTLAIAASRTLEGIQTFLRDYSSIYHPIAIGYDHSAFTLVKILGVRYAISIPVYLARYTALASLMAAGLFLLRSRKMPRPNQVLTLCILTVLLPSTSFDYTLQSLYIPWAWLTLQIVKASRRGQRIAGASFAMICFALLLGPETFLRHGEMMYAGPFKALVLILLLAMSLVYRFPEEDPTGVARTSGIAVGHVLKQSAGPRRVEVHADPAQSIA